ncbi:spore germination protein [Alicyclobacillus cellulosilyticus]|uniref:Spore germination protein n=1 Tax=Alicyclobacillus cellulosilyticus TaxID=1003997 RepID=A0A917KCQ8_9BACL|nr:spore germination protein [Alicyclobacillus cellulosilyticus]GGJ06941.1 spore germination protein [Alicyclobacillus cellulosilyticus]
MRWFSFRSRRNRRTASFDAVWSGLRNLHQARYRTARAGTAPAQAEAWQEAPLPRRSRAFHQALSELWQPSHDLRLRTLHIGGRDIVVAWLNGLTDNERLQAGVFDPLTHADAYASSPEALAQRLTATSITYARTMGECSTALVGGRAVVYVDRSGMALCLDVNRPPGRSVDRAENEPTVQGPQEAMVESLDLNVALLRKRLRTPRLKVETHELGTYSRTQVAILYIEGVAKPALVEEVRQRLQRIRTDIITDINHVREHITDAPFTLFPTTEETERPERVAGNLMQGRVAVIADGSPTALLVPVTFFNFLLSPEDYYTQFTLALPLRLIRHTMFWAAILLPALYVAVLSYNQDLIPTPLLISVAAQHAGIPFPTVAEALIMMFSFEALREAGTRLPRAVGQSVSIVGTLIIGDAAVRAGLVSPGMIIVIAATGVASFTLPGLGLVQTTRLLQFTFVLLAGFLGLYGIILGLMFLLGHLVSIRSFGVPYTSPIAPFIWQDMKDVIIRAPWWVMRERPRQYETLDPVRSPSPPPAKTKEPR